MGVGVGVGGTACAVTAPREENGSKLKIKTKTINRFIVRILSLLRDYSDYLSKKSPYVVEKGKNHSF